MNTPPQEDIRHVVEEFLVTRFPTAHGVPAIRRRVATELDFAITTEDVVTALEFLRGFGKAQFVHDDLGATQYWSATAAGVRDFERRQKGG